MFVTFEGIEGCGKTTVARRLWAWLEDEGYDVLLTQEPGGTAIGQSIRSILLDPRNRGLSPQAELHLYLADRSQHVSEVIGPALEAGRCVLCDRYGDSTVAYQGGARGLGMDLVRTLHQAVTGQTQPDLTFLLDLPVGEGLRRARGRGDDPAESRLEEEEMRFHERVREAFLAIAREDPDRVLLVDAARPEDAVYESVGTAFRSRVLPRLRRREPDGGGP